ASPNMATLEELHLSGGLGEMAIRALAKSPHLGCLRRLSFRAQRIGGEGIKALADSTCFPSLRELDLSRYPPTDDEADLIVKSSWMGQLYVLRLHKYRLSTATRRRLRKRFGHRLHL